MDPAMERRISRIEQRLLSLDEQNMTRAFLRRFMGDVAIQLGEIELAGETGEIALEESFKSRADYWDGAGGKAKYQVILTPYQAAAVHVLTRGKDAVTVAAAPGAKLGYAILAKRAGG